jgi:hypothetical protein
MGRPPFSHVTAVGPSKRPSANVYGAQETIVKEDKESVYQRRPTALSDYGKSGRLFAENFVQFQY